MVKGIKKRKDFSGEWAFFGPKAETLRHDGLLVWPGLAE
jgi:hypothetical protein